MAPESKSAELTRNIDESPSEEWAQSTLHLLLSESQAIDELVVAAKLDPLTGDLADADFGGLDLSRQVMSGWDLRNANFVGTKLGRTDLTGAVLNVENLILAEDWQNAKLDAQVRDDANRAAVLSRSVETLELSVRTNNALKMNGVRTIRAIIALSEGECLRLPNFGRKSLAELKEVLHGVSRETGVPLQLRRSGPRREGQMLP